MQSELRVINEMVMAESEFVDKLTAEVGKVIVGQRYMVERILIGLLTGGHVLLEGVPGLAKTMTVKTVSDAVNMAFSRIQFTPDLLPADIMGTTIYNPQTGDFSARQGPVFANLVLADEINRAPAKVQSALLEAMQERQVTIGDTTNPLPSPFLVMATQNPIEQEGTYPLPEAQLDRFMLMIKVITMIGDVGSQLDSEFDIIGKTLPYLNKLIISSMFSADSLGDARQTVTREVLGFPKAFRRFLENLSSGRSRMEVTVPEFRGLDDGVEYMTQKIAYSVLAVGLMISVALIAPTCVTPFTEWQGYLLMGGLTGLALTMLKLLSLRPKK